VRRKVGNDVHTLFWTDRWVGEVPLRARFSRLFLLSDFKGKMVAEMFSLGWGVKGEELENGGVSCLFGRKRW